MAIFLLSIVLSALSGLASTEPKSLLENQLAQLKVLALDPAQGQVVIRFRESHLLNEGDELDFFSEIGLKLSRVHRDRVVLIPTEGRDLWREVWLYRADKEGKSWARVLYSQAEEPPIYQKPHHIRLDLKNGENTEMIVRGAESDTPGDEEGEE